jgi:putative NADPH-quinone reductase
MCTKPHIYAVKPEKAYGNYLSAVIRAGGELRRKETPALKTKPADFSAYDIIFIGFPVWYGSLPSFLQEYIKKSKISGKRVIPFATAGANGKESSLETLKKLLPECKITDYFYTAMTKKADADAWLNGLKL